MTSYLLLIAAALGAGLMNSVAGGGSFLTFPALVFTGVPSIIANATSTVALCPGVLASAWAYRKEFGALKIPLKPAVVVSIAGGITGALLLLFTAQRTFDVIIPWLLLAATIAFAIGPRVTRAIRRKSWIGPKTLIVAQFLLGVYGGYCMFHYRGQSLVDSDRDDARSSRRRRLYWRASGKARGPIGGSRRNHCG